MWCPTVSSGAFVARRNGQIFITGNSGFPKSHDISKALDREAGAEREVVGEYSWPDGNPRNTEAHTTKRNGIYSDIKQDGLNDRSITAPATPDAHRWQGYGTALKPAYEPVILARAPRAPHTYAALAREFGTGAINVDGGRIQFANNEPYSIDERCRPNTRGTKRKPSVVDYVHEIAAVNVSHLGRWPANLILGCACAGDEHDADCPVRLLGEQSGETGGGEYRFTGHRTGGGNGPSVGIAGEKYAPDNYADTGTAARFFYTAKAAAWERTAGLSERSKHPTMKPIRLTEYLAKMLLPPIPARLLVPFSGVGSEMIGARLAGWDEIDGIEQDADYCVDAYNRVVWWSQFSSYEEAQKHYKQNKTDFGGWS